MKYFEHENVMKIVGVSLEPRTDGRAVPEILLPFMDKGDLLTHLKKPESSVTYKEVEYIESIL